MHKSLIVRNATRLLSETSLFSTVAILLLLFSVKVISAQQILLESTLLRCHEEGSETSPKNPVRLATSSKGHALDLKVFSTCKKKLLITLRITESTRDFEPNAMILIDRAKNTITQKPSQFGLPIAVKFHQDKLYQKYPLEYLYHVNGKIWEEVISPENNKNYAGCNNNANSPKPTCGFSENQVAGFCCTCRDHRSNVQQRGGYRCDVPGKNPQLLSSAHCLRSSPFTYNVYKLSPPTIYQKVRFEVFKSKHNLNGEISWEQLSHSKYGVEVDSDNLANASGAVKVFYRAHTEGIADSAMIFNASFQRLLLPLPNPFIKPEHYDEPLKGPIEDQILIVPKPLMAPNGLSCDRVGTRLHAFLTQSDACRQQRNSCLNNQPFDLWKRDSGPNGSPNSKFRLKSFGTVNPQLPLDFSDDFLTGFLFMEQKADASTYVDIEIPADDIIIHSPGYNAFIESVLTDTGSDGAKIVTQVMNKELIEASFSIHLVHCTINITEALETPPWKIGPLNSKTYHVNLYPYEITDVAHCVVALKNEYGEDVAAREVIFHPKQTCVCVHTCKCVCGEKSKMKCERLPDDNLIAAGLASEVISSEQLEAEEKRHSQQRSKRIFHWVLIVHVFIISLSILGALKALLGLCCCRPLALFGMEYFQDKLGASRTPTSRDIFCYNLSFFLFAPLILLWWIGKMRGSNEGKRRSSGNSSSGSEDDYEEEEDEDDEGEYPVEEYDLGYFDNSKDSGEESDVTLFKKQSSSNPPALKSRTGSKSTNNVSRNGSGEAISRISRMSSKSAIPSDRSSPFSAPVRKSSVNFAPPNNIPSTHSIRKEGKNGHKMHKLRSIDGPGMGELSDRSMRVNMTPSLINFPGSGGPQAARSTEFRGEDNKNNNNSSTFNFFNTISTSSSRTSFGAWHRRRRDQYSAYDFLPEPKSISRGSY
ncbi:unnamed protein product [Orchesella dallaii]|uniref:Generative cell specific-1/HAP2 domain-containing protein n=1 Tax=Orchesella dallaii TaxID=48710 RepID=A0ABP1QIZ3_9HEXA